VVLVRPRTILRLGSVLALTAAGIVGGIPGARPAHASPATVLRRVPIDLGTFVSRRHRGSNLRAAPAGALAAGAPTATQRVRVCSPIWFTALGLSWNQDGGRPIEIDVSTSRDGRSFGRTRTLDAEGGPDPGSIEYAEGASATELLWTGGGRCARVALRLTGGATVSDLDVDFINSSGTPAGPATDPIVERIPAPSAGAGALAPQTASAATRQPRFISRERWGANPRLLRCTPDVAPAVKMAFVHHTAGVNHYSRGKTDDIIRAIYAYHTQGQGWCDIAYNFLIDRFGRAYEGRSGGITNPVVGAATQGFNTGSFSVSLLGNFTHHRPSRPMMRTLRRVIAWRLDVAHVAPHGRARMVSGGGDNTRYRRGRRVRLPVISAHRYTGYTVCPGKRVSRRLPGLRDAVVATGRPKIYGPSVSPDHVRAGGDAEPVIRASGSGKLAWSVSVRTRGGAELGSFPSRRADSLRRSWTTHSSPPLPSSPGLYDIVINAVDGHGRRARGAVVPFRVSAP
jgi:N-acetylmuramoyl-L-alanine amidase